MKLCDFISSWLSKKNLPQIHIRIQEGFFLFSTVRSWFYANRILERFQIENSRKKKKFSCFQHRRLDAIYFYVRALATTNLNDSVKQNLIVLFEEARRRVRFCFSFGRESWETFFVFSSKRSKKKLKNEKRKTKGKFALVRRKTLKNLKNEIFFYFLEKRKWKSRNLETKRRNDRRQINGRRKRSWWFGFATRSEEKKFDLTKIRKNFSRFLADSLVHFELHQFTRQTSHSHRVEKTEEIQRKTKQISVSFVQNGKF